MLVILQPRGPVASRASYSSSSCGWASSSDGLDVDCIDFKPASGVIIQGQQTLYSFWCTMSAQATNLSARVRFTAESDCNLRICRLHIGLYQELKGFSSSPKFFDRLIHRWVQYFCIDYKPAKYALTRISKVVTALDNTESEWVTSLESAAGDVVPIMTVVSESFMFNNDLFLKK